MSQELHRKSTKLSRPRGNPKTLANETRTKHCEEKIPWETKKLGEGRVVSAGLHAGSLKKEKKKISRGHSGRKGCPREVSRKGKFTIWGTGGPRGEEARRGVTEQQRIEENTGGGGVATQKKSCVHRNKGILAVPHGRYSSWAYAREETSMTRSGKTQNNAKNSRLRV